MGEGNAAIQSGGGLPVFSGERSGRGGKGQSNIRGPQSSSFCTVKPPVLKSILRGVYHFHNYTREYCK